jgi:hypothetical protein
MGKSKKDNKAAPEGAPAPTAPPAAKPEVAPKGKGGKKK